MAECIRFVCESCSNAVEAWDDGNPYYYDRRGKKKYAYHPDPKRERCVGNDSPRLCLECGAQTMVDSKTPSRPLCHVQFRQDSGSFWAGGTSMPRLQAWGIHPGSELLLCVLTFRTRRYFDG